jgi:cell pole-organizing protein PopZ
MDDLLASIRRAIHDEGLDFAEAGKGAVIPLQDAGKPANAQREVRPLRSERPVEVDDNEIVALRNKISRELSKEPSATVLSVVPNSRQQPVSTPFKSLLGGKQAVPSDERPAAMAQNGAERSAAIDRPSTIAGNLRRPVPAPSVRPHHDSANRAVPQFRAPFGQSSSSVRRFQPRPVAPPTEGMISAETSNVTAGAFSRLAEQMFGPEDGARSIDDLARELLHPMLKQWLDENLPRIVEQLVREEIERVARRGRR